MSKYNKILTKMLGIVLFLATFTGMADAFTIANTSGKEMGFDIGYDGTNYLVGIKGDANNNDSITVQFVSKSGSLVMSRVSIGATAPTLMGPIIGFDETNYLIVWTDGASVSDYDIYGQFMDTSGNLVGSTFTISGASGSQEIVPGAIAFDGTNYLVVWEDHRNDTDLDGVCDVGEGTCADIYGQLVTTSGTLSGSEFQISVASKAQLSPHLIFDGSNYLVVWSSKENTGTDIYARFISTSGVQNTTFKVNQNASNDHNPTGLAFDGTNYLAVWNFDTVVSTQWDIYGRLFTASGTFPGNEFAVSTQPFPFLAYDGTNYLVSWTDTRNDSNKDGICDAGEGNCTDIYG